MFWFWRASFMEMLHDATNTVFIYTDIYYYDQCIKYKYKWNRAMKNWKRGNYILQYSLEYHSTYVLIRFEQMLYHEIAESNFQLVDA